MTKTAKKYICNRCNREFPKKYNLTRHTQKSSCAKAQHELDDTAKPETSVINKDMDESIFSATNTKEGIIERPETTKLNEQLEQSNNRLRIINESILRTEQDIKNTVCNEYTISKLRDAVLTDIINEIKRSNRYTENREVIDECFKLFEPRPIVHYTIDSVLLSSLENRIDLIKTRTDNLARLKKDKLSTLTEISGLTVKIVELLK